MCCSGPLFIDKTNLIAFFFFMWDGFTMQGTLTWAMHGLLSGSAVASFAPPEATHDGAVVFVMHWGNVKCSCSFPLFLHRILAWEGSATFSGNDHISWDAFPITLTKATQSNPKQPITKPVTNISGW